MKKLILWVVALLLAVPSVSFAGDAYFVSKNGSNSNTGLSWAQAWLTAGKADSTLSTHGDTIVFGTGTWTNTMMRVPSGGSPSSWQIYCCSTYYEYLLGNITYAQAVSGKYSGGAYKTQITSGQPLTSWTLHQVNGTDSVWRASYVEDHDMQSWGSNKSPYSFSEGWAANKADSQFVCIAEGATAGEINTLNNGQYAIQGSGGSYTIYMVLFSGSGNPNTNGHTYWASGVATFVLHGRNTGATKYTRIWGLEIKHGHQGTVLFLGNDRASCSTFIEHCHVAMVGQESSENAGVIMARSNQGFDADTNNCQRWVVIRNDSIGWSKSAEGGTTGDNLFNFGVVSYDALHWYVDSCVIYGNAWGGVHWKNDDYVNQIAHPYYGNVVSNSYIFNVREGIHISEIPWRDSIYGNVISTKASLGSADQWAIQFQGAHGDHPDSLWKYETFISNNTFFLVKGPVIDFIGGEAEGEGSSVRVGWNNSFRWNVVMNWIPSYATGQAHSGTFCNNYTNYDNDKASDTTGWRNIDSNMYWNDSPYVTVRARWNTSDVAYPAWRSTYLFDTNSDTLTNPGLNDPYNTALAWQTRFSRPSASGEMAKTYGGQNWTVFGAIQPTGGTVDNCPSVTLSSPANGATVTTLPLPLRININDVDGDSVEYKVFASTSNPPWGTMICHDTLPTPQSNVACNVSGLSSPSTIYWGAIYTDSIDSRVGVVCVETTEVRSVLIDTFTVVTPSRRGILIKPGGPQ